MCASHTEIRVRFAPSPTGYLHVGGGRTHLFNWLFAKHSGGKLILRMEDTDQVRSTRESEKMQMNDIHWLGLEYDEGPDKAGPYGPYRQSERLEIYAKYSKELLDSDRAYYCFCSDELLTQKRETAMKLGRVPQYDGTCRKIPKEEALKRLKSGEKASVRFKAVIKEYRLKDVVRGEVVFPPNMVGDFIILRNDGMPVYNFCCVIDDHLMKISHVIRAEEHLSNTVRQMMLYETFGWESPIFAHCSIILGADRTKLSKRHGAASVNQYAEEGFLKEALLNFWALLGWTPQECQEILSLGQLVSQFSLEKLHKAPSVFDPVKLRWMNSQYIRHLPLTEITQRAIPFMEKAGLPVATVDRHWLEKAFDTIRGHLEVLSDAPKFLRIFFDETFELNSDAQQIQKETSFSKVVEHFYTELKSHLKKEGDTLSEQNVHQIEESVKTATGVKGKNLFMPMRVALTGQTHGPELRLVLPLLGATRALARVEKVLKT